MASHWSLATSYYCCGGLGRLVGLGIGVLCVGRVTAVEELSDLRIGREVSGLPLLLGPLLGYGCVLLGFWGLGRTAIASPCCTTKLSACL